MMLGTMISRDKKPTLQLLTHRKVVPLAFMCEPCRLISRLTNEQNASRAPGTPMMLGWGPTLSHSGARSWSPRIQASAMGGSFKRGITEQG